MLENSNRVRFIFKTKSKRNILALFNYRSLKKHNINEEDIKEIDDYSYISIDLKKWIDPDTGKCFEGVLQVLLKLTDPKSGRPGTSLAAIVAGHDHERQLDFIFTTDFREGKHRVIGYYENGEEMIYHDSLYLTGNNKLDKFNNLCREWKIKT